MSKEPIIIEQEEYIDFEVDCSQKVYIEISSAGVYVQIERENIQALIDILKAEL